MLNVDTVAGQSSAKSVDEIVNQMREVIKRIQETAHTGKASWDGSAAGAFVNVHNEWDGIATKLNTALGEIANSLGVSMKSYDSHDAELAGVINQTMGSGGLLNL